MQKTKKKPWHTKRQLKRYSVLLGILPSPNASLSNEKSHDSDTEKEAK